MAVKFQNFAKCRLFVELTRKAVRNIGDILCKHVDLSLVIEGILGVFDDSAFVLFDLSGIHLVVALGGANSLSELKHFKAEGFNCDNLIGVNIHLFLIAFLICEWFV